MKASDISADRPGQRRLIHLAGFGTAGFLSALCALEGRAPLAAGLLAAAAPGGRAAAVLSGALLGAFSTLSFTQALRCGGILVLIFSVISAFRETSWSRGVLFRPLTAAGTTLAVELAYTMQACFSGDTVLRLLSGSTLAGLLCHYCTLLLRESSIPRHKTTREAEALRRRLRLSADALRSLCDSFSNPAPKKEENPAVVFDRAAEVVCRGCALRSMCWNKEYNTTFNAFNDATPTIMERGRAEAADFADYFANRCIHFPQLISAINTEVSALLLRRQYRRQLAEERQRCRGQYTQLADLVMQTMVAEPARESPSMPFDIALGSTPREGQRLCGDSLTYFKGEGTLYLLLSDGMGSGREAQRESQMTLRLLQQFLTAGIHPEPALRTLNAALTFRSEEQGSFTTIDLLALDLSTRQAELFKYGAAPTYIKRGGSVRRLTGSSLPAGLQDTASVPPAARFPLESGTFLLMISDGVADTSDDGWLQDLLAGWQGEDPNVLVSRVLRECYRHRRGEDDCSAMCLYLPRDDRGKREV